MDQTNFKSSLPWQPSARTAAPSERALKQWWKQMTRKRCGSELPLMPILDPRPSARPSLRLGFSVVTHPRWTPKGLGRGRIGWGFRQTLARFLYQVQPSGRGAIFSFSGWGRYTPGALWTKHYYRDSQRAPPLRSPLPPSVAKAGLHLPPT